MEEVVLRQSLRETSQTGRVMSLPPEAGVRWTFVLKRTQHFPLKRSFILLKPVICDFRVIFVEQRTVAGLTRPVYAEG